jgi:hypothetical protein
MSGSSKVVALTSEVIVELLADAPGLT